MATVDLGLSFEEFLGLQPGQLAAMASLERRRRRERDLMSAQIAAAVVNAGFCRPEKSVSAEDFLLRPIGASGEPTRQLTPKQHEEIGNAFVRLIEDHNAQLAKGGR